MIQQQRHEHVLAMQCSVRAHMWNRLVPGAKIPIARRRQTYLSRLWRCLRMYDLHDAVGIIGVERGVVRVVHRRVAKIAAESERVAGLATILIAALITPNARRAPPALSRVNDRSAVRRRHEKIDRWAIEQHVDQRTNAIG